MYEVSLNEEHYFTLLLMMGYATGSAIHEENIGLANRFIQLTNEMNKNNPHYVPYEELPKDYKIEPKKISWEPRRHRGSRDA